MFKLLVAASCLVSASVIAAPTTLTFDSLPTLDSGGVDSGTEIVEKNFHLMSAVPGNQFNAFQDGWQQNRGGSSGSTYLASGHTGYVANSDQAVFTLTGPGTFNLLSIDLGELTKPDDFSFNTTAQVYHFVGNLVGGGILDKTFAVDGNADGVGGFADFQRFYFESSWSNLTSVTMSASRGGPLFDQYLQTAFDSIVVENLSTVPSSQVPEPGSLALIGVAIAGLAASRKRA